MSQWTSVNLFKNPCQLPTVVCFQAVANDGLFFRNCLAPSFTFLLMIHIQLLQNEAEPAYFFNSQDDSGPFTQSIYSCFYTGNVEMAKTNFNFFQKFQLH